MGRRGSRSGVAVRNLASELESLSLEAHQTPELDREPVVVCAPSPRIDGHYEPRRVFGHYSGYSRQSPPARDAATPQALCAATLDWLDAKRQDPPK